MPGCNLQDKHCSWTLNIFKSYCCAFGLVLKKINHYLNNSYVWKTCSFWGNKWDNVSRIVLKTKRNDHGWHERWCSQWELIQHNFEWYFVHKKYLPYCKPCERWWSLLFFVVNALGQKGLSMYRRHNFSHPPVLNPGPFSCNRNSKPTHTFWITLNCITVLFLKHFIFNRIHERILIWAETKSLSRKCSWKHTNLKASQGKQHRPPFCCVSAPSWSAPGSLRALNPCAAALPHQQCSGDKNETEAVFSFNTTSVFHAVFI